MTISEECFREVTPNSSAKFASNQVRTTKYSLGSFLPICLFLEFRKAANAYFLIIAVLQSIPLISPLNPITAICPLLFVVGLSLIKQANEEHHHRILDRQINTKKTVVLNNGNEYQVDWQNIKVGDVGKIYENEFIPADCVILYSSESSGSCLVDTCNLDGETSLKSRSAIPQTVYLKEQQVFNGVFTITCEQPDEDIYKFRGRINLNNEDYSLDDNQLLPRGCQVQNTKWVAVLYVYTGHETKIMKNAKKSQYKISNVEVLMNRVVIYIFIVQVILCAFGGFYQQGWIGVNNSQHLKFWGDDINVSISGLLTFLSYVVLLNTLIPVSLIVSIDFVKTVQVRFIAWDNQMKNEKGNGAIANSSSLIDELGQVSYLFSDKTGTLTQNIMEFKKCTISGKLYGISRTATLSKKYYLSSNNVHDMSNVSVIVDGAMDGKELFELSESATIENSMERRFLLAMALCHRVRNNSVDGNNEMYFSDSPDEVALVRGAHRMGVKFVKEQNEKMYISCRQKNESGSPESYTTLTYEVLQVLPFSSSRKRMSIILRNEETRTIIIYCKGADCVILERCKSHNENMEHLKLFAVEGLRTLCYAEKELTQSEYDRWSKRYHDAEVGISNREQNMEKMMDEIEQNLTLLGVTAVEDKLQEGVSDTITRLIQGGIRIWVLTGDKQETAIEIGRSCSVILPDMDEYCVNGDSVKEVEEKLRKVIQISSNNKNQKAMIIDGNSLAFALIKKNRLLFLEFALSCDTVIVARASPLQKALIVDLVKEETKAITMAVGDGANDVSMIRSAHVGVGVMGQEGMQAIRSSDFAVQQFQHLDRLLLYHGCLSYMRIANCINYFFYKNVVFTVPQFLFATISSFSGQTFFSDFHVSVYNVCFTALPVVFRAILEKQVPDEKLMHFPQLYRNGSFNSLFSVQTIVYSIILGIYQATVMTFIPLLSFFYANKNGQSFDIWASGIAAYIYIVFTVTLQICFSTWFWSMPILLGYSTSFIFFFMSMNAYESMDSRVQGVYTYLVSTPLFYIIFLLTVVLSMLPSFIRRGHEENFKPNDRTSPIHIIRRSLILDNSEIHTK